MIWLVLTIAAALVIWIVRAEILSARVRALEHEVHRKLRPRVHRFGTRIMRLEIKAGIIEQAPPDEDENEGA